MELKHFWKFKQIIWTIEYLYFYATPDTQKTFLQPLDPVYYTLCPKKATWADTVFLNRGPLKVLYDSKYNVSHLPLWSFKTLRGPLSHNHFPLIFLCYMVLVPLGNLRLLEFLEVPWGSYGMVSNALTYNFLTIVSFRIRVPLILKLTIVKKL